MTMASPALLALGRRLASATRGILAEPPGVFVNGFYRARPDPMAPEHPASLSAAADARPDLRSNRSSPGSWFFRSDDLLPSIAGGDVEHTDVAARQQLKRLTDLLLVIERGAARLAERFKQGGIDEVRHKCAVDVVAKMVVITGIAELIGVK